MPKNRRVVLFFFFLSTLLSGCISGVWTGASLVYDRHHVYKKLSDYKLYINATKALFSDRQFKQPGCLIDIAVFNGDVLVVGHIPSWNAFEKARKRLLTLKGYRRLFNELTVKRAPVNTTYDAWITAKIRAHMFADSSIDLNAFKIVTADRVVYIMGEVKNDEAEKVIRIARQTQGVNRVIKILKYFTYQGPSVKNMA